MLQMPHPLYALQHTTDTHKRAQNNKQNQRHSPHQVNACVVEAMAPKDTGQRQQHASGRRASMVATEGRGKRRSAHEHLDDTALSSQRCVQRLEQGFPHGIQGARRAVVLQTAIVASTPHTAVPALPTVVAVEKAAVQSVAVIHDANRGTEITKGVCVS